LVATPYHGVASRLKEVALGDNPRGTIGTGVGEAFRDSVKHPEEIIRVGDLRRDLRAELAKIRDRQIEELRKLVSDSVFLPDDLAIVEEEMQLLEDPGFLDHNVERFLESGRALNIVDPDYMEREILKRNGVAIVESSHGILTDNRYGFHPHVSAIRTLPNFTHRMLVDAGFDGELTTIGVHRAYTVRHGAGPMPTADPTMNDDLLPGSHKEENRYQGKIRVGPLDFVLLRYAIDACGGRDTIDGLAISWFDQISQNGVWKVCNNYGEIDRNYFHNSHRIRIFSGDPARQPDYQRGLCSSLFDCKPEVYSIDLPDSMEEQYRLCDRELRDKLGVPVHLVSFGPAEQDKLMKDVA
jgi:adenylosuccinate synthase